MIDARSILASTAVFVLLTGCGQSARNPAPAAAPAASRADVIITFDGKHRKCVVALSSEPQGSTISCGEVASFVTDQLRVASGAGYEVRKIPDVDETEVAKVRADLNSAGYRLVGASRNDP
jgi:uncharacterized metal-binding protein